MCRKEKSQNGERMNQREDVSIAKQYQNQMKEVPRKFSIMKPDFIRNRKLNLHVNVLNNINT